jgi:hypothetical protein
MKTISLEVSDKTADLIKRMNEEELKKLKEKLELYVSNPEELEISISPVFDFGLNKKESREEYVNRVNKAIRNLDKQTSNVTLSDSDFENLTNDLLAAK